MGADPPRGAAEEAAGKTPVGGGGGGAVAKKGPRRGGRAPAAQAKQKAGRGQSGDPPVGAAPSKAEEKRKAPERAGSEEAGRKEAEGLNPSWEASAKASWVLLGSGALPLPPPLRSPTCKASLEAIPLPDLLPRLSGLSEDIDKENLFAVAMASGLSAAPSPRQFLGISDTRRFG